MIFLVIRIVLLLLRKAGYNAPQMPTLRQRKFLFEQILDPDNTSGGGGGFGRGLRGGGGLGGFGGSGARRGPANRFATHSRPNREDED